MFVIQSNVPTCRNSVKLFKQNSQVLHKYVSTHGVQIKPDFTKNHWKVQRGPYSSLNEKHLSYFKELLGKERIVINSNDLEKYNVDIMKHLRGSSQLVLKPRITEEVSSILSFCNKNKLAVVPHGGNTGLVGGATPIYDEIVISAELMKDVIKFDELQGILVCQAGCVLQDLNNHLLKYGYMMPIDLGAKAACQIGGMVSTNAGGLRLIRYGNLHGNLIGLEAVKANGEVIDCLTVLKKNNTGYHLKHLFVGSEGTLGFVTQVSIQCVLRPISIATAFLGLETYGNVVETFQMAKKDLGEILSAFEVIDGQTMLLCKEKLDLHSPIGEFAFYILLEAFGSKPVHDYEMLNSFYKEALSKNLVTSGTVSNDPEKVKYIWSLRERVPEAFCKDGYVISYDLSLPLESYYQLAEEMRHKLDDKSHRVFGFGHAGDSNLHLQISMEKYDIELIKFVEAVLFKRLKELNGSISAEHGIGFLKKNVLPSFKSKSVMDQMRSLKNQMDPSGILNPYKVV